MLTEAIQFASIKHRNQRRKDVAKTPYINHPIEVMNILARSGVTDAELLAAAVLHDTVEDTGTKYEELVCLFGTRVANMVMECTDNKSLSKRERKELQVEHSSMISVGAKLIKAADKLSNLTSIMVSPPENWTPEYVKGYFVWAYFVWQNISGLNPMIDDKLYKLFETRGITQLTHDQLTIVLGEYYAKI